MQKWTRHMNGSTPDANYRIAAHKVVQAYWPRLIAPFVKHIMNDVIKTVIATHIPRQCAACPL
jgi:hypothetical protein